ncbi:MAG: penicillin-binding protein activator [Alphaproteobacteria bacterium]
MKRVQFLFLTLLLGASMFLLQACGSTSSGYNRGGSWQYNTTAPRQAIEAPRTLDGNAMAEIDAAAQEQPIAQDGLSGAAMGAANFAEHVRVAILLPLSGTHADLGQAMLNAAQMALFEVGHNSFELIPRDTKGTAEGARSAAQDATASGAQIILGPIFADEVRAVKPVTRSAGISMIAFSTDWTLADQSTYLMGFMPFDQVNRITSFAASRNMNTIGVFAPATSYGDAVVNVYNNIAHRAGLRTLMTTRFAANGSDIQPKMRDFSQGASGQRYDAILMPVGGDMARSVGRAATQNAMPPQEVKRLGTGLWDDPSLSIEPSLEGGWFAAPSPRLRQSFERRYSETFMSAAPRLATLAYDATALTAVLARTGLQRSGRPAFDPASIQNPNGFAGIDGIFRFRDNGVAERGLAVLEISRGQIRIIDDAPRSFQQVTN